MVPVISYGLVGTVSSPNHTFFFGKLDQVVNQYFVHILSLVTDKAHIESAEKRKMAVESYFMINLQECMGLRQDRTCDPKFGVFFVFAFWVCFFTSKSTAMVMSGWSVHLTTLFFPEQT